MMLLHIKKEPLTALSDSKHIITKDCTSEHNKKQTHYIRGHDPIQEQKGK